MAKARGRPDARRATEGATVPQTTGATLGRDEFASALQGAGARLWTLAASIVGDRSEADDVLQEASVIALNKLETFRRGTSFPAWMGAVVRNVALNHSRRRRPLPLADEESLEREWREPPGSGAGSGDALLTEHGELAGDAGALDDDLVGALGSLAPLARACLLLRTVQQLSYAEISELLDVPEGTAMSHVHRARASLRTLLAHRRPASAATEARGSNATEGTGRAGGPRAPRKEQP